jgi:subtilisin family serine protease
MNFKKLFLTLALGSVILAWSFPAISFAGDVDVLIQCNKPYAGMVAKIKAAGGKVRFQYKYVNGIAATIPESKVAEIAASPEVLNFSRDMKLSVPKDPYRERPGYALPATRELVAEETRNLTADELKSMIAPTGYFPFEADLTNALDFWNATGHFGEGVIVAVMGTGFQPASFITSRLVGYENFTGDGVDFPSTLNNPHETEVASAAGGNTLPLFNLASPTIQRLRASIIAHLGPANVIDVSTDADPEPELVGIPVVGQAPACLWYGLKVANTSGIYLGSAILAAMERAIQLKDNFNKGLPGGVNIRVLNGSFGGPTLFAGQDPFFALVVGKMKQVGIVPCFAAANDGPAGLTIADPGAAKNILTVGASDVAAYEKIFFDAFFFLGLGDLFRANNDHQVAVFSSRGPNADGRSDPELVAPGTFIWLQSGPTSFSIGSGTSYSTPMVTGAAAALLSANPNATPNTIRPALLWGANRRLIAGKPGKQDQGFGFLDVLKAHQLLAAGNVGNPPDRGRATSDVKDNIRPLGISIISSHDWTRTTERLLPGQRQEYYFTYDPKERDAIDINVSVTSILPPDQQNQLFGDDILFTVHSAKTSDFFGTEYLVGQFVGGLGNPMASFHLDRSTLDKGVLRVTVFGDWTNVGEVFAVVSTKAGYDDIELERFASDAVAEGEINVHTLDVPAGLPALEVMLGWKRDWASYPTDDVDLIAVSPSGVPFFDGATLDAPEHLIVPAPEAGTWTFLVQGFTVWNSQIAEYKLYTNEGILPKLAPQADQLTSVPTEFGLEPNYPNPFNPSTKITYHVAAPIEVKMQIFNLNGQLVKTLVNDYQQPGSYTVTWNGRNRHGQTVASGVYIYRLTAGEFVEQKRMAFVK